VRVRFSSRSAGAVLECKLDHGHYRRCHSPHSVDVGAGRHTIFVRASVGSVTSKPVSVSFTVIHK